MSAIALAARVVLAIAFVFAAVEKLRDLTRVREQMAELLGARVGGIATIATPIVATDPNVGPSSSVICTRTRD